MTDDHDHYDDAHYDDDRDDVGSQGADAVKEAEDPQQRRPAPGRVCGASNAGDDDAAHEPGFFTDHSCCDHDELAE